MNSIGRGDKRPRDDQPPQFMVLDKAPIYLRMWYENMSDYGKGEVFKRLGFLRSLLYVEPRRDVIEALVSFWDPLNNVFHFADFELTPTLEEIGAFMGTGKNLHKGEPMKPKHIGARRFLELLHIKQVEMDCLKQGWVHLDFLYKRYGRQDGFEFYGEQLCNRGCQQTWERHSYDAFVVAFLGIMVFPKRGGKIDINLAAVLPAFEKRPNITLVSMVLADIYRALTRCKNGEDYFEGCNILLQIWMLEHVRYHPYVVDFKVDWNDYIGGHKERIKDQVFPEGIEAWKRYLKELTADKIVWNYHWFPSEEVIYMSTYRPFIVLMGLRGVQPYAPLRVMRQLGRRQFLPRCEDMQDFMYEFHPNIPLRESEIFKIWGGRILSGPQDRVADRSKGEVDRSYLVWFHAQPPLKAMPERSARGALDHEAETEVRIKQARLEIEENYRSTLDNLNNALRNVREELAQHEATLEARVRVIQKKVEKENRVTIQSLREDLDITAGAMEQQEEEFKKEKTLLIQTQSRLQAQLKASMERERNIARRFTAYQAEVETERNQWTGERNGLLNQVEEFEALENNLNHEIHTTQNWLRNCHENMEEAKGRVLQLAEDLINVYGSYLHRDDETLGQQARALAPHLPKALFRIYSNLRGD